jgi:hypothetical protein
VVSGRPGCLVDAIPSEVAGDLGPVALRGDVAVQDATVLFSLGTQVTKRGDSAKFAGAAF